MHDDIHYLFCMIGERAGLLHAFVLAIGTSTWNHTWVPADSRSCIEMHERRRDDVQDG